MRRLTTEDLIAEVRSLIDESDEYTVTDTDILSAINRAQDTCTNTLAVQYEDPLLATTTVTIPTTGEYTIPNALEDRIEKVEVLFGDRYYQISRVSYRDIHLLDYGYVGSSTPGYYYVKGRTFVVVPEPASAVTARVWYLTDPLPLAASQGRLTAIGSDYISVNLLGDTLTTDFSDLNSYISIINGGTGEVRASFQISKIENSQKITLKATPLRSTVLGMDVSGSASLATCGAILDDYVVVHGNTCIPFLKKPLANAIIYLAVADIKGTKLNQDVTLDAQKAMSFLKRVETAWAGRENTCRVKNKNSAFRKRSSPRYIR